MSDQEEASPSEVPERCPTCETPIPKGRTRCPGCKRVFGEANRCPHCNAVAPVRRSMGRPVCSACGGPREVVEGTEVLGEQGGSALAPRSSGDATQMVARGSSAGMRVVGVLGIAGGVLAATLAAAVLPGAAGVIAALVLGGGGVGVGALALRSASRARRKADEQRQAQREQAVIELARESGGDLTVTDAARHLGIGMKEAEALLTSMADGTRVTVDVTTEGIVRYVFRELQPHEGPPRVRVDAQADTAEAPARAPSALEEQPQDFEVPADEGERSEDRRRKG